MRCVAGKTLLLLEALLQPCQRSFNRPRKRREFSRGAGALRWRELPLPGGHARGFVSQRVERLKLIVEKPGQAAASDGEYDERYQGVEAHGLPYAFGNLQRW